MFRQLTLGLLAGLSTLISANAAAAADVTVAAWGGSLQDVYRDVYFKPFTAATGDKVVEDVYLGGWAQFEAMQQTGVINWDVVEVETSELVRGCDEGTFVQLDWSRIADKAEFIPNAASDCGLGVIVVGVLPAFNADLVTNEPDDLTDFWDLTTWPGKRGMRAGPKHNLELALLADGVDQNDVYSVLATPDGLDRAFTKLDAIKSNIQWWESGDQPASWLLTGDVAMAIAYNARISNANAEGGHLKLIWDKFTYDMDSWAILEGASNVDGAYDFLSFYAKPAPQTAFMQNYAYGTPSLAAAAALTAEESVGLPVGDKMAGALFAGSDDAMAFWLDNYASINERWNAWASAS